MFLIFYAKRCEGKHGLTLDGGGGVTTEKTPYIFLSLPLGQQLFQWRSDGKLSFHKQVFFFRGQCLQPLLAPGVSEERFYSFQSWEAPLGFCCAQGPVVSENTSRLFSMQRLELVHSTSEYFAVDLQEMTWDVPQTGPPATVLHIQDGLWRRSTPDVSQNGVAAHQKKCLNSFNY